MLKIERKDCNYNESVFNEIYYKYNELVLNHVRRIIKDYHKSEEITNDVFIKINRLNKNENTKFNPQKSSLKTWVYTITNTGIIDFYRLNKRHDNSIAVSDFTNNEDEKICFDFIAPKNQNADGIILTSELQEKILFAFRNLKPNIRKVGMLFFIKNYKYDEIAEMLNIPLGSVKPMISRCREKLQITLKNVRCESVSV